MPWARLDDSFYDHPKILAIRADVRNAATGLFARALSRSNRRLSDGRITVDDLALLDARPLEISELVRVKLWRRAGKSYRIHDFLDFNKPRAQVLKEREAKVEGGRKGGLASGRRRRGGARSKGEASASSQLELPSRPTSAPNGASDSRPVPSETPPSGGAARAHEAEPSPEELAAALDGRTSPKWDGALSPDVDRLRDLTTHLTGQDDVLVTTNGGFAAKAISLLDRHGYAAVERAMRAAADGLSVRPTLRQLVFAAEDSLDEIPRPGRRTTVDRERAEFDEVQRSLRQQAAANRARRMATEGAGSA